MPVKMKKIERVERAYDGKTKREREREREQKVDSNFCSGKRVNNGYESVMVFQSKL